MIVIKVTVHAKYTPNLEKVRTLNQRNVLCCIHICYPIARAYRAARYSLTQAPPTHSATTVYLWYSSIFKLQMTGPSYLAGLTVSVGNTVVTGHLNWMYSPRDNLRLTEDAVARNNYVCSVGLKWLLYTHSGEACPYMRTRQSLRATNSRERISIKQIDFFNFMALALGLVRLKT